MSNPRGGRMTRPHESEITRSASLAGLADQKHQDAKADGVRQVTSSEAESRRYADSLRSKLKGLSNKSSPDSIDAFLYELAAREDDCVTDDLLNDLHKQTKRSLAALKKGLRTARKKRDDNVYVSKEARDFVAQTVEKLNDQYAVSRIGSSYMVADIPANRGDQITFMDAATLHALYANRKIKKLIGGRTKEVPITKEWWEYKFRRTYFKPPVFDPSGKNHCYELNLWRGLAIEPKQGDWSLMRRHLFKVICRENPLWFAYLHSWVADVFKNPAHKPGVAFNLSGRKGTGKSKVADWLRKIMPANSGSFSKGEQVWGKHNTGIQQCLLAVLEEAFWAGDKAAEGRLKDLITSSTQIIEPKFVDPFEVQNFTRLWLNTNEPWSFPASGDERRLFALATSEAHRQDIPYFKAIDAEMEAGGLQAMLWDFLNVAQPAWIELRLPPDTPWLINQISFSLPSELAWLRSILTDGVITPGDPYQQLCVWADTDGGAGEDALGPVMSGMSGVRPHPVNGQRGVAVEGFCQRSDGGIDVPTDVVRGAFRKFVAELKGRSYVTPERLGDFLRGFGVERVQRRVGAERPYVFAFPPLEMMRKAFRAETKIDVTDTGGADGVDLSGFGLDGLSGSDLQRWVDYGTGGAPPSGE